MPIIDAPQPQPQPVEHHLDRIATALERLVDLHADATIGQRVRSALTHQPRSDDLPDQRYPRG